MKNKKPSVFEGWTDGEVVLLALTLNSDGIVEPLPGGDSDLVDRLNDGLFKAVEAEMAARMIHPVAIGRTLVAKLVTILAQTEDKNACD